MTAHERGVAVGIASAETLPPMTDPSKQQAPSPDLFFQTVNAHQRTAALKAALDLGLFTAIAGGDRTPAALARRCDASQRGMRKFADRGRPLTAGGS